MMINCVPVNCARMLNTLIKNKVFEEFEIDWECARNLNFISTRNEMLVENGTIPSWECVETSKEEELRSRESINLHNAKIKELLGEEYGYQKFSSFLIVL